ncbi:MAG: 5,10-methylenetetrahydromethanopterin reductase [Candidatus Hadarchaeota archaeon]
MKFGVELVPYYQTSEMVELAKEVEEHEFDYLWISDHYHRRYIYPVLTQMAGETSRINLGPGVTNPYLTHPTVIASAIATVDEISKGRATLGISAGDPSFLNSVGIKQDLPITRVREAIKITQRLLSGEKVDFSGEVFTCNGAKLGFKPPHNIPIYVGGRGPQMMQLAGSIADGALFNACHPRDLSECLEYVEEGLKKRDLEADQFDSVAYMATSIGDDEKEARDKARAVTSFVAASAPQTTIEREKLDMDLINEIRSRLMNGEVKKAKEKVTPKMIDLFSVSGNIQRLEDRIEEVKKLGIFHIVIGSPIGPDMHEALEKIGSLISRYP